MIKKCLCFGQQAFLRRFVFFLRENSLLAEGEELLEFGRFVRNRDRDSFFPGWWRRRRGLVFADGGCRSWRGGDRMWFAFEVALIGVVHQVAECHQQYFGLEICLRRSEVEG